MTRSEAAQICQSIKFILENSDYTEAVEEALDMAIAALKQLSLPKIIIGQGEQEPSAQPFTEEQIQTMQELESAQVEKAFELGKADRTTGHWIENVQEYYEMINEKCGGVDENTPYFTDDIACSECLAKFSVIDNETERFDFCPNCGCAMKGGEEE